MAKIAADVEPESKKRQCYAIPSDCLLLVNEIWLHFQLVQIRFISLLGTILYNKAKQVMQVLVEEMMGQPVDFLADRWNGERRESSAMALLVVSFVMIACRALNMYRRVPDINGNYFGEYFP